MSATGPGSATPTRRRTIRVLLVEDSPADIELTRQALQEANASTILDVVSNGEDAIEFVRACGKYRNAQCPDLILLDLNLPRKDGREVLAELKSDERLRTIPVVVLTTSANEHDIVQAYRSHANSYIRKPLRLDELVSAIKTLDHYWLETIELPPPAR